MPAIIESVSSDQPDSFFAELLPKDPLDVEDNAIGSIIVKYNPKSPEAISGNVLLKIATKSRTETVALPTTGNSDNDITILPKTMRLPRSSATGLVKQFNIVISSRLGNDIEVRPDTQHKEFNIKQLTTDDRSRSKSFIVSWNPDPDQPLGHFKYELGFLVTSNGNDRRVSIQIDCDTRK